MSPGPGHRRARRDGVDDDAWSPQTTLLEYLESKGVDAAFSCREGNCSACSCRILEREVKMLHNDILDADDLADGVRIACQSVPVTDTFRVAYH